MTRHMRATAYVALGLALAGPLAAQEEIAVTPLDDNGIAEGEIIVNPPDDGLIGVGEDPIQLTPLDELIGQLVTTPIDEGLQDEYLTTSTDPVAVSVANAASGELRVLDKLTGTVTDLSLAEGETETLGFLSVTLQECRYPVDNPAGDAFALVQVLDRKENAPLFAGWILASAPALNAMDHPRYDVWALRCITS
ncbi:MAG: DUF2155 domain-containing protein [Pseudomonadota bacterium]